MIDFNDLSSYLLIKKGLSTRTAHGYMLRITYLTKWLTANNLPLQSSSIEQYFLFLRNNNVQNRSMNLDVCAIKALEEYFKNRNKPISLLNGIQPFKFDKKSIDVLSTEEIEKILSVDLYSPTHGNKSSHLENTFRLFTMFLAFTGCRISEALELQVQYVDIPNQRITFEKTKGKEFRRIYISNPLLTLLKDAIQHKRPTDLVFTNHLGNKLHKGDYLLNLRKRTAAAGVTKRVHPHLFRHSLATQLLVDGVDITLVATILGHKDISTTYKTYVHLADKTIQSAMSRHSLVRKNINPMEIIKQIKDAIIGFHLESDSRFGYKIEDGDHSLNVTLFVK